MAIRERWFVDAFEFTEGDVRDVEYREGLLGTPAARGDNAVVDNRTGEQWRPKVHGAGDFTLAIWFGNNQLQAQQQWDTILRAIVQPHRLPTWRRVTASGESRYCQAEVTASLKPTAIGQLAYRAQLEVHVPSGYWRGDQLFTYSTPVTGGATRDVDLTDLAVSTAAMEDLTLTLTGNLVRPRITDVTPYGRAEQLFYDSTIAANTKLAIGTGDWSTTGIGGHVPKEAALNYSGERYLTVAATPPGVVPKLRLTADTLGAGGQLTVAGYRSYLC